MNIVLISPPLHGMYKAANIIIPPIGLLYVASYLKAHGHQVRVTDRTTDSEPPPYEWADAVGITAMTLNFNEALTYARTAHEHDKIVVMGGVHPTTMPDESLMSGFVDYVVRGEGEETALDLFNALEAHGRKLTPDNIPGISWLNPDTGRPVHNPERSAMRSLAGLPMPERDSLHMEYYKATRLRGHREATTILTSRGCPYDCNFCVVPKINSRIYRVRPVDEIIEEMLYLRDVHGFRAVIFVDDNLTINHRRTEELCNAMIDARVNMVWWCMSRADTLVKHPEMVALMAKAGCVQIFIGLESGSERILKLYNKNCTAETGAQAVTLLKQHNIDTFGAFILGADEETVADVESTIKYALRLGLESAQFSLLTPYPGTDVYEEVKHKLITRNWDLYDGGHALFSTRHLDMDMLNALLKKAFFRFYLRPSYLLKRIRSPKLHTIRYMLNYVRKSRNRITEDLYQKDHQQPVYEPLHLTADPVRLTVNE
jgi:anaerobic magnesium-protoporphyrin IX monomethyl ester cyclase